jgi:hypothetical protein
MHDQKPLITEPAAVPPEHPLRGLFQQAVRRAFHDRLGLPYQEVSAYLTELLVDFVHRDNLFRIRDRHGVALDEVAEMLLEADVAANATSFDRERAVHKHIGDFTLFWAGIYPEALKALQSPLRADHLLDYVRQGKQSYYIVSTFAYGRYAGDAGLFRRLSEEFELCIYGLSLVRREWQQMSASRQGV